MASPEAYTSFTTSSNAHEHGSYARTTPFGHSHRNHGYGGSAHHQSPHPPANASTPPHPNHTGGQTHQIHTPSPSHNSRHRTRSSPSPPPHAHQAPYKNGKKPSLASPLPPSPLVPTAPDVAKRYTPAPLNLLGSPSSLPYLQHRRPGTAGSLSGSVSGLSSPPLSPTPSPPQESHGSYHHPHGHGRPHPPASKASSTHHAQYVTVQARPYTANGALPDSPSTAAMMKRLLAKPAPVGSGSTSGGLTSGSESEGWTSSGMGYVRRKTDGVSASHHLPSQSQSYAQVQDTNAKDKDKAMKKKPSVLRRRASANNTRVDGVSGSASSSKASFHPTSPLPPASAAATPINGGGPPLLPAPPVFAPLSLSPIDGNGPSAPFFLLPPSSSSSELASASASSSHPTFKSQTTLGAGPASQISSQHQQPNFLSGPGPSSSRSHPTSRAGANSDSRRTDRDQLVNESPSNSFYHTSNLHHHHQQQQQHHNHHNQQHRNSPRHQHQTHTHSHHQAARTSFYPHPYPNPYPNPYPSSNTAAGSNTSNTSANTKAPPPPPKEPSSPHTHDGATGLLSPASSSPSSVPVSHRQHNNRYTASGSVTGAQSGRTPNFSHQSRSQEQGHALSSASVVSPPAIPPLPSPTYSPLQSPAGSSSKAMHRSLSASAVLNGNGNGSGAHRKGRQDLQAASPSHPSSSSNSPGAAAAAAANAKPTITPKPSTVSSMLDSLRPPLPHLHLHPHAHSSSSHSASRGSSRTRGSRTSSPARSPILSSFNHTNSGSYRDSLTVVPSPGAGSAGMYSPISVGRSGSREEREREKEREKEKDREREKGIEKEKAKDREKEKERGRTPAASLIEAYKRQEKEREEREKERAARRRLEEESRRAGKRRTMLGGVGLGGLEGGDRDKGLNGSPRGEIPKAHSQPSSRRHSLSLVSPGGSSTNIGGAASASASGSPSPIATIRRTATATATATASPLDIDRNLLSASDALQRRKDVHSYASGHTTDSAQDLIHHVGDDAPGGVLLDEGGFAAIEKMVEVCEQTSKSPPALAPPRDPRDDEPKLVSCSSSPSGTQPHTPQEPEGSEEPEEPSRESMLATPYYTVVGTSSGRVVAVGSREDSTWSTYGMGIWESGVMARNGQPPPPPQPDRGMDKTREKEKDKDKDKEKEKEKMSIGRSLTRKMSGRWKKQGGMVVGSISSPSPIGEDEGRGRMLGRGSMQEKRVYAVPPLAGTGAGVGGDKSTRSMSRSRSRPRREVEEAERRRQMKNRRSLRLSIDKFDDRLPTSPHRPSVGVGLATDVDASDGELETVETAEAAAAAIRETGTGMGKKLRKTQTQKHESSPSAAVSPNAGGSKIWRLMKRISIGSGLREKFHESGGAESPPPVPALPKNVHVHALHGSRSTESSFKGGSSGKLGSTASSSASSSPTQAVKYGSSPVTDTHPAVRSSSKPPSSPLTTTVTTAAPALPLSNVTSATTAPAPATSSQPSQPRQSTTTRSSSPVFSSSSDVGSSKFFHRTLSARSSTSSLGLAEPVPPMPMPSKPMAMLGQHIVAPSELRKVDGSAADSDGTEKDRTSSKRAFPPKSMPISIPKPTLVRRPSTAGGHAHGGDVRALPDDDWMIVKSPDVELPSLPLPPPRRVPTLPAAPTPSTSSTEMAGEPAPGSVSWDVVEDVDNTSEGGGSPIIPTFSTEEPSNLFPARRASAATTLSPTSTRRLAGSPTSPLPSAGGSAENEPKSATASVGGVAASPPRLPPLGVNGALNIGSPTSPPPPRPQRSSQRPPPPALGGSTNSSVAGSPPPSGPLAPSSLISVSPPSSAVPRMQVLSPRVDDIPMGRKSESHVRPPVSLAAAGSSSRHQSAVQRRSISVGSPSGSLSLSSNSSSSRPGTGTGTGSTHLHRSASSSVAPSTISRGTPDPNTEAASVASATAEEDDEGGDADPTDPTDPNATEQPDPSESNAKRKFALTEQEKAERWADLLERSEKAGGTLRVEVGGLAGLGGLGGGLKRLGFR